MYPYPYPYPYLPGRPTCRRRLCLWTLLTSQTEEVHHESSELVWSKGHREYGCE